MQATFSPVCPRVRYVIPLSLPSPADPKPAAVKPVPIAKRTSRLFDFVSPVTHYRCCLAPQGITGFSQQTAGSWLSQTPLKPGPAMAKRRRGPELKCLVCEFERQNVIGFFMLMMLRH